MRSARRLHWVLLGESLLIAVLLWTLLQRGSATAPLHDPPTRSEPSSRTDPPVQGRSSGNAMEEHPGAARVELRATHSADGCVLCGAILDELGEPVPAPELHVLRAGASRRQFADVGPHARYAIPNLLPGEYEIRATSRGFRPWSGTLQIAESTRSARLDVVLRRAVLLAVRARTRGGVPLEQAMSQPPFGRRTWLAAVAVAEPLTALPVSCEGSVRGLGIATWRAARFANVPDPRPDLLGVLELDADPPVHVCLLVRQTLLGQQLVPKGGEEVLFEIDLDQVRRKQFGSVALRVVDARTGQPAAGATVALSAGTGGGAGEPVDGSGRYLMECVAPGMWELEIRDREHAPFRTVLDLQPGAATDLGDIGLHAPRAIEGILLDPAGVPVQAALTVDDLEQRRFPQALREGTYGVDTSGRFSLSVGPSRQLLRAHTRDSFGYAVVGPAGPDGPLELRLQPAVQVTIESRVAPDVYFLVVVRTLDDVPLWAREVRAGPAPAPLLPHGDYVVDIHRGVTPVRSFALRVGAEPVSFRVP